MREKRVSNDEPMVLGYITHKNDDEKNTPLYFLVSRRGALRVCVNVNMNEVMPETCSLKLQIQA